MKDFFPKVSVIVPIEEVTDNTEKSIKRILSQTHHNIEALLVGTKENLEKMKAVFQDKCSFQEIESFEMNKALNVGIKESKGEFISFLFHNDLIKNDFIEKGIIAFSKAKEDTGFIFSKDLTKINEVEKEQLEKGELSPLFILTGNIQPSSVLFRKQVLEKSNFTKKNKTTAIEHKLLELINQCKFMVVNDEPVENTRKDLYDLDELIELWNEVLGNTKDKEIINTYNSLHDFYNKGIETFERYDFIFPKSLHDKIIKNSFNPLISVVIPVYNGSNYIKEAIQSVLNQTYTNYELLVIEDGSTDGGLTKKCIDEFEGKLIYHHKENGGVGSALNLGIEKAKGDYISWLSHDDMYLPQKLQMQVDALNEVEDKDTIVFTNFQLMDENSVPYVNTDFLRRFDKEQLENKIFPVLNGTTCGCAMLIPKVVFKTCGLFDVSQRTTNDYIMWFNIFEKYPSKFLVEHLTRYRIHKSQDSQSSPIYVPECEEMWTSVFKGMTKKDIEDYGYSELEFYAKFYREMKAGGITKAADYLEEQYKKIYKKNGPLVSVIMPCYNSEKFLHKAVDSILNQSLVAFELICVDDLSTDSTYELLKEYEKKDFRVKAVKNNHKKGVAGAMNTGLDLARGEYITRMDSDDISYPERLMTEFNFLKKHKEYGTCTVNIDLRKDGVVVGVGSYVEGDAPIEWKFLWNNPYPNPPSMYRKEIIKDFRFNENLSIAEDYQFLLNVLEHKIYYIDEVHYSYRISQNSLYHSNKLKSIYNSLEVASNFYYEVTKKDSLPEIYYYLSYFSGEEVPSFEVNKKEVLEFLDETLELYSKHFKWSKEEYDLAKNYALTDIYSNLIEKITRNNSYDRKQYQNIINSMSWKITKPLRFTTDTLRRGKRFAGRVIRKVKR